jgi:hypothetical protein
MCPKVGARSCKKLINVSIPNVSETTANKEKVK